MFCNIAFVLYYYCVIGFRMAHAHARAGGSQEELTEGFTATEDFFERNCCIRGYHVYNEVWEGAVGEALVCETEPENTSN